LFTDDAGAILTMSANINLAKLSIGFKYLFAAGPNQLRTEN
jgi:hypothetical protein